MDIKLYHGSDHVIKVPDIKIDNIHNDYGKGFYCTQDYDMACEWACKKGDDGFVNEYRFDIDDLKVLNLLDDKYSILNWIAILLKYRTFRLETDFAIETREYLIDHFAIDLDGYDVVIGYRADDSYFRYAQSFIANTLPLGILNKALYLGKLGKQVVVISKKGFDCLDYVDSYPVSTDVYYPRFIERDTNARASYKNELTNKNNYKNDIFVLDILREEIDNNDPRIQRIVFK